MLKTQVILEIAKEERKYILSMENESPLGEVFDVLTQMRAYVVERIQQGAKDQEPKPKIEEANV